jgi:tetratricopeptide (TPR) repeat protein
MAMARLSLALLVCVLLFGGFLRTASAKPSAGEFLRGGNVELSRNNFGKAIRNYTRAIELDRLLAEAYVRRGMAFRATGNLDEAIEDFTRALTFNLPNDFLRSMIYANRGLALQLQGKREQAQSDFRTGLEPNSGQRILIQLHLRSLETQIREMRRRRAQAQRKIA